MIELFTTSWNEEFMLPRMVDFYRARIPDIIIHVYDNHSTDNTVQIAKEMGCHVHSWDTNGEIRDDLLLEFKNNIWKNSKADWVIVCDVDEWVDFKPDWVPESMDWFRSEGYNMVNEQQGMRYHLQDKVCVFRPKIGEVRYSPGAHTASPQGTKANWSPVLYHMKYAFGVERVIEQYKHYVQRLSQFNKDKGYGFHYAFNEQQIREEYDFHNNNLQQVGPAR